MQEQMFGRVKRVNKTTNENSISVVQRLRAGEGHEATGRTAHHGSHLNTRANVSEFCFVSQSEPLASTFEVATIVWGPDTYFTPHVSLQTSREVESKLQRLTAKKVMGLAGHGVLAQANRVDGGCRRRRRGEEG